MYLHIWIHFLKSRFSISLAGKTFFRNWYQVFSQHQMLPRFSYNEKSVSPLCYLVGQSLRAWIKWLAICIFSTLSYHVGTSITLKRHKKVAPTDALFQTMILHYSSLATWMADNIIKKCLHNWTNKLFLKHRWWRKWALCKKNGPRKSSQMDVSYNLFNV